MQVFRLVVDHCESAQITESIDATSANRDSCEDVEMSPDPDFRLLNLVTPLEVGGLSASSDGSGLPNNNNFEGCLKDLRVNDMVRVALSTVFFLEQKMTSFIIFCSCTT